MEITQLSQQLSPNFRDRYSLRRVPLLKCYLNLIMNEHQEIMKMDMSLVAYVARLPSPFP